MKEQDWAWVRVEVSLWTAGCWDPADTEDNPKCAHCWDWDWDWDSCRLLELCNHESRSRLGLELLLALTHHHGHF